jgi:uncharacterized iron-regulated membrane protein
MVLLLIVLAVTALLIVFWVSGLVLRFARRRGAKTAPGRRSGRPSNGGRSRAP